MSETVHYRGTATEVKVPKGKALLEVVESILKERGVQIKPYHSDALECLIDNFYYEYFYLDSKNILYKITKEDVSTDGDIIHAEIDEKGFIKYELKYYNGGAGFQECLEEAITKII